MKIENKDFELFKFKMRYDYTPIIIVLSYLNFTYLMHLLLNETASANGLIFISIINLSIIVGYVLPIYNNNPVSLSRGNTGLNLIWENQFNINRVIVVCSIISILSSLAVIKTYYSSINELFYYLQNPGQAYLHIKSINRNPELYSVNGGIGSGISILLTLLSATKHIYLVFSLLYWKQLKRSTHFFFLFGVVIYILHSLLIGSMITIGELLFALMPILIINFKRKPKTSDLPKANIQKSKRLKMLILLLSGILLLVFYISNRINEENNLYEGIEMLGFYISHGYVGLDYCLELPFEFTFGFTSFRSISSMLVKYLGAPDLFQNSYLVRNEIINGYPALSIWSTIFPWLASDFSFYLVPLIIGIISYQFSLLWNKTLRTGNPFGYLLLGQFFLFWIMIPANNQLLHSIANTASLLLIIYLYNRSKRYFKRMT